MQTIWQFRTKNFRVALEADYEQDPDLSWADEETLEKLRDGEWTNYVFRVAVYGPRGEELGTDYLGNSIYADATEFRDHIGLAEKSRADGRNYGSYFLDMVRGAIAEARAALDDVQAIRLRAL